MTALSRAQQILETDQDFEYLHSRANKITNTWWDTTPEEIIKTWESNSYFHNKYIEEFVAWYKAAMCFAVAISTLLDKIHVEDDDPTKMYEIPGTDKWVNIYTSPKPWSKHFEFIPGYTGRYKVRISEDVSVEDKDNWNNGKISFTLEEPVLILNPVTATYDPKYMDSLIRIEVDSKTGITFKEMYLRDLTINKVLETINAAGIL